MSTAWAIGFVVGILIVAVACYVSKKLATKKGVKPSKFDERQLAARGQAFTLAYATLGIYLAVWMVLNSLELPFFATRLSVLIGLQLSVAVFAVYSFFSDAYFRTSDKPASWAGIIGVIGLLNTGLGVWHAVEAATVQERWYENNNLFVGIMLLAVFACMLVKRAIDKRSEAE